MIIITKTQPYSTLLRNALIANHINAVSLPLTSIAKLHQNTKISHPIDIAIFLSTHSANFGIPKLYTHLLASPPHIFAIGTTTQRAIQKLGFKNVTTPNISSSQGLLDLNDLNQVQGKYITIVQGKDGLQDLHTELTKRGAIVHTLFIYERRPIPDNALLIYEHAKSQPSITLIVGSTHALNVLNENTDIKRFNNKIKLLVPSERIVKNAVNLGFNQSQIFKLPPSDIDATIRTIRTIQEE